MGAKAPAVGDRIVLAFGEAVILGTKGGLVSYMACGVRCTVAAAELKWNEDPGCWVLVGNG